MAQQTEALCLLQNGALYGSRTGLVRQDGETIFAGFKAGAFSLYFGDEPIYHFDLDGRWQRAFVQGVHYVKGLDTRVHAIQRVREGENLVLRRRRLSPAEVLDLDATVRTTALELASATAKRFRWVDPPPSARPLAPQEFGEILERVAGWDAAAWARQAELFDQLYRPQTLPFPEAAQSILLQPSARVETGATRECGVESQHDLGAFEAYVSKVGQLWGRRRVQAKAVLLAGQGLWHEPIETLTIACQIIGRIIPIGTAESGPEQLPRSRSDSIIAYIEDISAELPNAEGWRGLAERGVARVIFDVVSVDAEMRAALGRPWSDRSLRQAVSHISQAGLACSPIVAVGSLGAENRERELSQAVELLSALDLSKGTLIYLVDFLEAAGADARSSITSRGFMPVVGAQYESLLAAYRTRLTPLRAARGVKIAPYSLEKQGL
jgi:hypothetical protein